MDKKVIAPFLEVFLDELPTAKSERKTAQKGHIEKAKTVPKKSNKETEKKIDSV